MITACWLLYLWFPFHPRSLQSKPRHKLVIQRIQLLCLTSVVSKLENAIKLVGASAGLQESYEEIVFILAGCPRLSLR